MSNYALATSRTLSAREIEAIKRSWGVLSAPMSDGERAQTVDQMCREFHLKPVAFFKRTEK